MGIAIISTPKGVIDGETARKQKLAASYFVWFGNLEM